MVEEKRHRENGFLVQKFGNGTTALYAALRSFGFKNKLIAVPAPSCPNVCAAVLASGNFPFFVDIERETYGLDPVLLESILPRVQAVVAVHAFGVPCDIERIRTLCRTHSLPLIEDCAQAEGAAVGGEPVGGFGDIAVYSFGAGKIIQAGGGGMAVTQNPDLAERLAEEYENLPEKADTGAAPELALFYKFLYNNLYPDRLEPYREMYSRLLLEFGLRLRARYCDALTPAIEAGRAGLEANLEERRSHVETYRSILKNNPDVTLLNLPEGSAPWRFNVRINPEKRNTTLKTMIREKWHISSWYPDVTRFLTCPSDQSTSLDNSRWLDEGILNFWVDASATKDSIRRTCDRFLELLTG